MLWDIGSQILGGWLGRESADDQNAANRAAQEDAQGFNSAQAALNRDFQKEQTQHQMDFAASQIQNQMNFQERMSGTAYQRATADMAAAGLNPMLAYHQGGATTPAGGAASGSAAGGSAASSPGPIPAINKFQAGLSAAQQAATIQNLFAQNSNIDAQTEKTKAETQNVRDENPYIRGKAGHQDVLVDQARVLTDKATWETKSVQAQIIHIMEQTNLTRTQVMHELEKIANTRAGTTNIEATTANTKVRTALSQLEIPKATNEAEAQKSWFMKTIAPYLPALNQMTSSAEHLGRGLRLFKLPF